MRGAPTIGRSALAAVSTTAAAAGACATTWALAIGIGAAPGIAVLSTVIALTLSRRTFASRAEFLRSSLVLPVVGLVAAGVGWLLLAVPVLGAALFVLGMSVPIWMRRYGATAARLGTMITLPFTAILVAPVVPPGTGHWWTDLLMVVAASLIAIAWVWLVREAARLLPHAAERAPDAGGSAAREPARDAGRPRGPRSRVAPSTRMAVQMAAALAAAFVVGWLAFPDHAMWTVLTAFIVCSGNRGRGDVVYKSVLRVGGALAGTVAALALSWVVEPTGFAAVAVIFAALFVGTWLRQYSYAFWALTITLVLTMLQGVLGLTPPAASVGVLLAERLLAIVVGAVLGIAASWFLLPVRSGDVVRRRLADVLAAASEVFAPSDEPTEARVERMRDAADRLAELAPTHRAHRMLARKGRRLGISCIETAQRLPDAVDGRLAAPIPAASRATLRQAIGDARRSLAAPTDWDRIQLALEALLSTLQPPERPPAAAAKPDTSR
ncbi:FUSC family protein [Leifsonia sp. NPDC058292]|uniref:FUSC family protein n=1 Tax=Leifsonia sp. NPDC058292 TaxID=3346428 RepID=UPI0036DF5EA0